MTVFEIITALGGSGILFGVGTIIFKIGRITQVINTMHEDISSIKTDIKNIDARLNRLEGAFFERGQWESKIYRVARNSNENYSKNS